MTVAALKLQEGGKQTERKHYQHKSQKGDAVPFFLFSSSFFKTPMAVVAREAGRGGQHKFPPGLTKRRHLCVCESCCWQCPRNNNNNKTGGEVCGKRTSVRPGPPLRSRPSSPNPPRTCRPTTAAAVGSGAREAVSDVVAHGGRRGAITARRQVLLFFFSLRFLQSNSMTSHTRTLHTHAHVMTRVKKKKKKQSHRQRGGKGGVGGGNNATRRIGTLPLQYSKSPGAPFSAVGGHTRDGGHHHHRPGGGRGGAAAEMLLLAYCLAVRRPLLRCCCFFGR